MKQVEIDFLQLFRRHMSNKVTDHIYVPAEDIGKLREKFDVDDLVALKKKYGIWREEIVGVWHWVMNPELEIVSKVEILSLIKQTCEPWDNIHRGQAKDLRVSPHGGISDDDIPF